jgi:hypothetical protein
MTAPLFNRVVITCGAAAPTRRSANTRVSVRLSHGPVNGWFVVNPSAAAQSIASQVTVRAPASQNANAPAASDEPHTLHTPG